MVSLPFEPRLGLPVVQGADVAHQDYAMRVWMPYTNYSLTAVYRIGNFKEKQKKQVDTSRMGY